MFGVFRSSFSLLFALIALVMPFAASGETERPVLLYLFVEDGQAFTKEGRDFMSRFFAETLPGHRIALVQARDRRFLARESQVHRAVLEGMRQALRPGETVTHLVIATHGGTESSAEGAETLLRGLGRFGENGPDQRLAEILEPLRGRLASDAHIILDSCSTMCGSEAESRVRAEAFMKAIGAPDGTLYGATNPDVDVRKLGAQARRWQNLKPRLNLIRNLALVSLALGAPVAWLGFGIEAFSPDPLIAHLQVSGTLTLLLTAMFQYMEPAMLWLYEKTKSINQGRLFVFRRGRVVGSEEISKRVENLSRLYHARSCGRVWGP